MAIQAETRKARALRWRHSRHVGRGAAGGSLFAVCRRPELL